MAEKEISLEKLIELVRSGAKIRTEDRPTFIAQVDPSVGQFDALLQKLDAIVSVNRARIDADLARYQSMVELLANLQRMVKTGSTVTPQSVDFSPLQSVLSEINENTKPIAPAARPAYVFDVKRTNQGFIDKVIAIPQTAA